MKFIQENEDLSNEQLAQLILQSGNDALILDFIAFGIEELLERNRHISPQHRNANFPKVNLEIIRDLV